MEQSAAVRTREIYRSPNGDRWLLARGPETSRVFVRHEPTFPQVDRSWTLRSPFLIAAGNGPEKQELLRLIGTLV
jgi:hypothetical protein